MPLLPLSLVAISREELPHNVFLLMEFLSGQSEVASFLWKVIVRNLTGILFII